MDQPTGAFAAVLGISQLLYISVVLTLGARLLLLAIRTRQLPEALLSTHFLLCCGLGYLLSAIGLTAAQEPGMLSPGAITVTLALAHLGSCVGVFAGICFNFLVFRRKETWARGLVALAAISLTVGYAGYGLSGGFSHGRMEGPWFWLFYGTFAWGAAWVMIEPLRYYRTMRKRLQLGLAEPLAANRFLLWGMGSLGRFVMVVGGILPSQIFANATGAIPTAILAGTLLMVALVGMCVAGSYWLTFFPTRAYVRFVERRSGVAAG